MPSLKIRSPHIHTYYKNNWFTYNYILYISVFYWHLSGWKFGFFQSSPRPFYAGIWYFFFNDYFFPLYSENCKCLLVCICTFTLNILITLAKPERIVESLVLSHNTVLDREYYRKSIWWWDRKLRDHITTTWRMRGLWVEHKSDKVISP